jgi:hypothetical protein
MAKRSNDANVEKQHAELFLSCTLDRKQRARADLIPDQCHNRQPE